MIRAALSGIPTQTTVDASQKRRRKGELPAACNVTVMRHDQVMTHVWSHDCLITARRAE